MASLITAARAIELQPDLQSFSTTEINAMLDATSETVESLCGRKFALTAVTNESLETDQYGYGYLKRTPYVSGLTIQTLQNVTIQNYLLNNDTGELFLPTNKSQLLKVSYTGGFATLPPAVELAVSSLAKRQLDRLGTAGNITSKEIGSVKIAYGSQVRSVVIDESINTLLGPYMRRGIN